MTTPRVQFVTTVDGARIAYAVHGRGPAILSMPPLPFRHVELEWQLDGDRRWLERMARHHAVIQYDPRGLGLSDRSVTSYALADLERDIDAVLDRAAPEGAVLFAAVTSGTLAIAYAAHHPERVSHLVLWCTGARALDVVGPQVDALLALVDRDWELFTETVGHVMRGWSAGEDARQFAVVLRAAASPESVHALVAAARAYDVAELLPQVRAPTLVVHRRGLTWISVERAAELASRIPQGHLVILDGNSMAPWAGDMEAAGRAIDEFLGSAVDAPLAAEPERHVFRREGEYWTLSFAGHTCRLRDVKGLHHLAHLLQHPSQSVSAAELIGTLDARPAAASPDMAVHTVADLGDAGPLLDVRAKRDYRRRIDDLRAELSEAEQFNDTVRAAAIRTEIERLAEQLAAAIGLGGRDRKAGSAAERARLTVTKRIRDALERIRRAHPDLATYLNGTIRTGFVCTYEPKQSMHWSF